MVHISERDAQLPDHEIAKLLHLLVEDKSILSLGPGEPDFELPKPLVAEVKRLANQSNHYASPQGLLDLRKAICKKLKKENKIQAEPDNVVVTCGSQEALLLSCAATLDVTEQILIGNPSYMDYVPLVQLLGAVPRFFTLREEQLFEPDVDVMRKEIDKKKTKAIMLNSPANPTGNVIRKKVLEEIADLAVEFDLAVFSDEAYEKIVFDDAKHISMGSLNGMSDRVFTLQTFSKSFAMCGFRLGYVVAPERFAKLMKESHTATTICAPTLSQKLGIKALSLPQKYTAAMVKEYDRRRKVIVTRLNDMDLPTPMPRGAFYTFSNISHIDKNSKRFAYQLLKHKVAVIPGIDFGSNGEGHIRCSFATKLPVIEKALDRLEKFVQKRAR